MRELRRAFGAFLVAVAWLSAGAPAPAGAGEKVKAVVVRSWSDCNSRQVSWKAINARWPDYGQTPVTIDYAAPGVCNGPVTYDAIASTGADVLILSNPAGGLERYSTDEMEAVSTYVHEGHGVVGSFVFLNGSIDDRPLMALFGLADAVDYTDTRHFREYHLLEPQSPLFIGIQEPYATEGWPVTQVPIDGSWGPGQLTGARIVARSSQSKAVITAFDDPSFRAVYISSFPEYLSRDVDAQFWYNAIVYASG
jgi:hypothetical protein